MLRPISATNDPKKGRSGFTDRPFFFLRYAAVSSRTFGLRHSGSAD